MALAFYVKKEPKAPRSFRFPHVSIPNERYFFASFIVIGLVSVIFAIAPIIIWEVKTLPKIKNGVNQFPVPQGEVLSSGVALGVPVEVVKDPSGFSYFTTNFRPQGPRPRQFLISIPKIKVLDANVLVDTVTFNENLSHFPGSALPGEVGNSFITGHSVLDAFYDPKNYRTIFTKLPDMEIGDDVFVEIWGQKLHFVVQYLKVVDPKDVSVLAPISKNGRNLTLMTCVPPGTSNKRLIVVSSLI